MITGPGGRRARSRPPHSRARPGRRRAASARSRRDPRDGEHRRPDRRAQRDDARPDAEDAGAVAGRRQTPDQPVDRREREALAGADDQSGESDGKRRRGQRGPDKPDTVTGEADDDETLWRGELDEPAVGGGDDRRRDGAGAQHRADPGRRQAERAGQAERHRRQQPAEQQGVAREGGAKEDRHVLGERPERVPEVGQSALALARRRRLGEVPPGQQRHGHAGGVQPERAPPGALAEDATDQGVHRRADGDGGGVDPQRRVALWPLEGVAEQGHRDAEDAAGADPLDRPEHQDGTQPVRRDDGDATAGGDEQAPDEDRPAAVPVGQRPGDRREDDAGQRVDGDDQARTPVGDGELPADGRQERTDERDAEDGGERAREREL